MPSGANYLLALIDFGYKSLQMGYLEPKFRYFANILGINGSNEPSGAKNALFFKYFGHNYIKNAFYTQNRLIFVYDFAMLRLDSASLHLAFSHCSLFFAQKLYTRLIGAPASHAFKLSHTITARFSMA